MKCAKDVPSYDVFLSKDILIEIFKTSSSAPPSSEEDRVLADNLRTFGLDKVEMLQDGDCLFHSVLFSISQMLNSADDNLR